jgi:hypothetical protein
MALNPALRATGVNYEPGELDPATSSTGHLSFQVDVTVMGRAMTFEGGVGVRRVCAKGTTHCALIAVTPIVDAPGYVNADLHIGRFAEAGRLEDTPFGPLTWLVTLEDGHRLIGSLRAPAGPEGAVAYPGEITLGGRMVIVVQIDGQEPVTLRSRRDARQQGIAKAWPPYGTELSMVDGPVDYFDERRLTDADAEPFLRTEAARIQILSECPYLSTVPRVVDVTPLNAQGLPWAGGEIRAARVEWEEAQELRDPDGHQIAFDWYRVYRRPVGAGLEAWRRVGTVRSTQHFFLDTQFTGTNDVEYVVARGESLPFGYVYEGLFGPPRGTSTRAQAQAVA